MKNGGKRVFSEIKNTVAKLKKNVYKCFIIKVTFLEIQQYDKDVSLRGKNFKNYKLSVEQANFQVLRVPG